ncbi:MAG: DUF2764 family protein [Prolixibacteraceae bacterium]|jgi:hypothetical protein|nr:DUF2764 family protein [Prolixibacteraceae bacterium]
MGKYYYLISGLPELQLDDQKLKLSLVEFKTELSENLSASDLTLIGYFFMQFDNANMLKVLENKNAELDQRGNLNSEQLFEILAQFDETDEPNHPLIYPYFKKIIPAYQAEQALYKGMSWEDQMASVYFDYAKECKNEFVSDWYQFNLNITNILAAVNCSKFGFDRKTSIVGSGEIADAIRYSNAKDFDIAHTFPEVDEILSIAEESDIYERERKIDLLKWNWLEEKGFFHYFDVEHLFIYLLRLELLERWVRLEKETGLQVFREMIGALQHSFEFPNEFTIKKVK